jgi:hypothetical protein
LGVRESVWKRKGGGQGVAVEPISYSADEKNGP